MLRFAILFLFGPAHVFAADPLATLHAGHPRLLLTDAGLAGCVAAAKTDPLRTALHARIIALAERDLALPPIERVLIGPRLLDKSRTCIARVLDGAMAFRLTGDKRFAERAKREMLTAAAFADWNPTHFLDVAEMATALAIGYDWLYPQLTPDERATIRRALVEKALSFAPAAYAEGGPTDKRCWFVTAHHNWNQVCNGGLLAAALALADEEPDPARTVIAGALRSLPLAREAYAPDGAYPEGPGYWEYGTTYNAIAIASLESALGQNFGLADNDGLSKTALYRLHIQGPTGLAFNHADGHARIAANPCFNWLALRYRLPSALAHARAQLSSALSGSKNPGDRFFALHAVWFPTEPPSAAPAAPLDVHFRGSAELALFRSAWGDPGALFIGFKAGANTVNHAHLDLGSFVLDADGVRWAIDLGPDDYNLPSYFGAKRWTYYRLSNLSHNTLTPGGALQDKKAVVPLVAYESTPERAAAVADLTPAYPGVAARILRRIALLDRSRVLVEDDMRGLAKRPSLRWAMVTEATIALSDDRRTATLSQGRKILRAEILAPAGALFSTVSTKPPTELENKNAGTSMLAIDHTPATADVRLAVLLTPVGDRWPRLAAPALRSFP